MATPHLYFSGAQTSGLTRVHTVSQATNAGDHLVIVCGYNITAGTLTITDSQNNVYTLDASNTTSPSAYFYRSAGPTGGPAGAPTVALSTSDTVTITVNNSGGITPVSGIAIPGTYTLDVAPTSVIVPANGTTAPATATPTTDGDFAFAGAVIASGSSAPTYNSPFVALDSETPASALLEVCGTNTFGAGTANVQQTGTASWTTTNGSRTAMYLFHSPAASPALPYTGGQYYRRKQRVRRQTPPNPTLKYNGTVGQMRCTGGAIPPSMTGGVTNPANGYPVYGGTGVTWRVPQQRSRAVVGDQVLNAGGTERVWSWVPGQTQPLAAQPHQRDIRQRHRAVIATTFNNLAIVTPTGTGTVSHAVNTQAVVPAPTVNVSLLGTVQPPSAQPNQRSIVQRHRGYFEGIYTGLFNHLTNINVSAISAQAVVPAPTINISLLGTVQPVTAQPHQRALTQRNRGYYEGIYTGLINTLALIPATAVSAQAIVPAPTVTTGAAIPNGTVQPATAHPWVNRSPLQRSRAYIRVNDNALSNINATAIAAQAIVPAPTINISLLGTVQPRATVPVPRRTRARAVARVNVNQLTNINVTPDVASAVVPAPTIVITLLGTVQPRATVPVPRRATSRAYIRVNNNKLTNINVSPDVASAIVPAPTISITLLGKVQPRATVPVPRRVVSRAYIRRFDALSNALISATSVSANAIVPLPAATISIPASAISATATVPTVSVIITATPAAVQAIASVPLPSITSSTVISSSTGMNWNVYGSVDTTGLQIQWRVGALGPGTAQDVASGTIISLMPSDRKVSPSYQISTWPANRKTSESNEIPMQE